MNILIINHYAGTPEMGMEFRPYYFAKEWVKSGHRVDIIAADFSHLRLQNPQIERDFEERIIDGIHYHFVHTSTYVRNGGKRAITMLQFVGKLWFNAKRIANEYKPDVIISSSTYPLDTYAGQRIKRYAGEKTKLIHEIHDMWPITLIEVGGMSKSHPFVVMMQIAENSFCKKADYVISLLPCAEPYLREHGLQKGKYYHVPNGILLEEWDNPDALPADAQQMITDMKNRYKKIFCFFGSHTASYALNYMIDAMKQVLNNKVGFLLVGDGNCKEELVEQAKGYDNIRFLSSIPKKSIPSLLEQVDAIYIGALNNRMFDFGISMNKLFDSMMSGKPILYAVNAPNNYILDYSCGVSVEPESTDALVHGITKMIYMPEEELRKMGMRGREAVLEYYTTPKLAAKFEKIMMDNISSIQKTPHEVMQ